MRCGWQGRAICVSVIGGIVAGALLSARAPVRADEPQVEFRENVEYGSGGGQPLTLHLARPAGLSGPVPAIAFIHGGGWRAGSKDAHIEDIKKTAAQGYVAVSVGYRFAPEHRFPAQIEDCKCAIRWLRAHAGELSIDPERIGAIGFSAGAHLSMLLGTMDSADGLEGEGGWADQSSKVQAVVAYFGPTDFNAEYPALSRPLVEAFLGGTRDEVPEAYRAASPLTYVSTGDAPILILQGTNDVLVPYTQAISMVSALADAKVPGRIEMMLGAGHGWGGTEMERTRQATADFFDQYLGHREAAP